MSAKRLFLSFFVVVCLQIMPFMAGATTSKDEVSVSGKVYKNSASTPPTQSDSGGIWKTELDVTAINQNSFKYTWHKNSYAHAAGCVPASFAMLIDYEVRQSGYKKIDFVKVMRQLRQQYVLHGQIPNTAKNKSSTLTSKIISYFKPIPTSVDMTDKNFDMVLEKLDLGNGHSAGIRLKAHSKLNKLNRFLGVVKENLDRKRPVAVQTNALDKNYVDPPVGNKLKLKLDRDPRGGNFPWTGGHEMVIMGYETNAKCTDNSYKICRLILNDTNSSSPQYFDIYKAYWENHDIGVALSFKGEGGMNKYVYIIIGTDLDLIAISGLEFM